MAGNSDIVPSAELIIALLAQRHSKDFCVPECKTGPSQGVSHRRMDMWAMKKSWAHPTTWAYEVKISRSDFLADEKWGDYLPFCNMLSFVCPYGMIKPDEVPENTGLIWCSKAATRLYTKKKAPHRQVDIPETLWRYVLMRSRPLTRAERWYEQEESHSYWTRWLETKREDRDIGHRVSESLATIVRERIVAAEKDNESLKRELDQLEDVRQALETAGISPFAYAAGKDMVECAARLKRIEPDGFRTALRRTQRNVTELLEALSGQSAS